MRVRFLLLLPLLAWWGIADAQDFSVEAKDLAFAVGLYRDRHYRLAEEELASFIRRYPQSTNLHRAALLRADCLVELQQYRKAVEQAREVATLPGELGARAKLALGRAMLGLGLWDDGEAALGAVLRHDIASEARGEALHFLAWALRRRGACDEALPLLDEAASLAWPGSVNSAVDAAWCLIELGRAREVESRLANLLAGGAPSPMFEEGTIARGIALLVLNDAAGRELVERGLQGEASASVRQAGMTAVAEWWQSRGELPEAVRWFRQAAALEGPGEARALYGLGWCLLDRGEPGRADSVLAALVGGYPDDDLVAGARYGRGKALLSLGKPTEAGALFREVLALHPLSPEAGPARWELASLAMEAGHWDEADSLVQGLLGETTPPWLRGQALDLAAESAFRRGQYGRAIRRSWQALSESLPPDVSQETALRLGVSLIQEDRASEASAVLDSLAVGWPTAEVWLWLGEALFHSGSFQSASEAYERAAELGRGPLRSRARYGRAWSLLKLGQWREAEREFSGLAGAGELGQEALLRKGDALFNQKRYDEATAVYSQVASGASDSAQVREALFRLATAQARDRKPENGLDTLDRLLRDAGGVTDEALMLKGDILFQQGRYSEAAEVYTELVGLCRDRDLRARAQYRLGDSYYNQGLHGKAAWVYRRFLLAFPEHELLTHAADGLLRSIAQTGGAEAAARVADSLSASADSIVAAVAAHSKASLLLEQGDEEAAVRQYQEAARAYPWSAWADQSLLTAGQLLAKLGRDEDALGAYEKLRRSHPNSDLLPQTLYSEAEALIRLGRREQAVTLLSELRRLTGDVPLIAPGTLLEAQIRWAMGQRPEAESLLGELVGMGPGPELEARARLELADVTLAGERWAEARRWAAWVVERRSDELAAKAQLLIGESFAGEGDWEKARREFLRVAYLYPSATDEVELAKKRAAECEPKLQQP